MDNVEDYAKQIVTPFGEAPWVQSGIRIKGPGKLKDLLMRVADESVYDLNPESCKPLKKRMAYGPR